MRCRYRYDADLDAVVPIGNYFEERPDGPHLIGDGLPGGVNGIRSHADGRQYDSKSRYLSEVKARGFEVVGNDTRERRRPETPRSEYEREVVAARAQIEGNWNDTQGWLRQHNERTEWRRRNG